MIKNILFPTDFSPTANNALVYAYHLAKAIHAELTIIHAYMLPIVSERHIYPEKKDVVVDQLIKEENENYEARIPEMEILADEYDLKDVKVNYLLEQGTVVSAIEKAISQYEIDLIVMGTTGASGFVQQFFGSNTVNVINMVELPVLCIPLPAKFKEINEIGFTTMFREVDLHTLQQLIPIAAIFDSEIKCLHVATHWDDNLLHKVERWKKLLASERIDFSLVYNNDPETAILEFAKSASIDVLVMVKRNRGFFSELFEDSMSNHVAYSNQVPVLVVQE